MGAWGAIIMGFFGAVFAALTLALQFGWTGAAVGLPFVGFAGIAAVAAAVIRRPGPGLVPPPAAQRVITWSSIGEGVGLFVAADLVVNLDHREWLLPAMALVVGLHFLPMAYGIPFGPFFALAAALLVAAVLGVVVHAPLGGAIAGAAAAISLWIAATLAVRRDLRAKRATGVS